MTQLPLPFAPDGAVQLALGMVRTLPTDYLEEQLAVARVDGPVGAARREVVASLLHLKRSLSALDATLGFDPRRWERSTAVPTKEQ